tara:strand:- start:3309 stop:4352 length:1044 start_codon:yes stop_codon:yes gene_type:complete
MKISIGTNIKQGPWGGGNLFAINLINYLKKNNHEVVNHLKDDDIDLILITEPRKTSESSAFTHIDVMEYLTYIKKDTLVVHRINECDERKNTNFVNQYLINANKVADHTVFVSTWIKNLYLDQGISEKEMTVILAGADRSIFNSENFHEWKTKEPLKIVTHHWGANWNKGFEIYQKLDQMIELPEWKDKLEFQYIGNLPPKFKFTNATHTEPLSGKKMAEEIKKNHLYLTASLNEPSGNHHIEAAQCGLPLLYINSGGIPEYCQGYGIEFNSLNFQEKLIEAYYSYKVLRDKVSVYKGDAELMSKNYEELFLRLFNNKKSIISKRDTIYKVNKFKKNLFFLKRRLNS